MPHAKKRKMTKCTDIRLSYQQLLSSLEQLAPLHASIPQDADVHSMVNQLQSILLEIDACFEAIRNAPNPRQTIIADPAVTYDTLHMTAPDTKTKTKNKPYLDEEKLDRLDREGVMLWNRSTAIKQCYLSMADEDDEKIALCLLLVSSARFAAARLVALGASSSNDIRDTQRLFSMYVRSGSEFCDAKALDLAQGACELATHEKQILSADIAHTAEPASHDAPPAIMSFGAYYHARAKLAFLQGKVEVADFLIKESLDARSSNAYSDQDCVLLSSLCYEIAHSFIIGTSTDTSGTDDAIPNSKRDSKISRTNTLNREGKDHEAELALQWLDRSLLFVGKKCMRNNSAEAKYIKLQATKAKAQLRIDIHQAGDRSSLLEISETLDDVITQDHGVETYCARLKLDLLLNLAEAKIENTVVLSMAHIDLVQENVLSILQAVSRMPAARRELMLSCFAKIVQALIERPEDGGISRLHLPLAAICRALTAELGDVRYLESLMKSVTAQLPQYAMPAEAAFLCQGVLWKVADWAFVESDFKRAALWYLLSTYQVFSGYDSSNRKKAVRKASLCYLRDGDVVEAQRTLLASSARTASDAYILYLCALRDAAPFITVTKLLDSIITAADADAEMLLWAIKQAGEFEREDVSKGAQTMFCDLVNKGRVKMSPPDILSLCKSLLAPVTVTSQNFSNHAAMPELDGVLPLLTASIGLLEQSESLNTTCDPNASWLCRQAIFLAVLPSINKNTEYGYDILQLGLRAYIQLRHITDGFDSHREAIITRFSLLAVELAFFNRHDSRISLDCIMLGANEVDELLSRTCVHDEVLTDILAAALTMRFNVFVQWSDWESAHKMVEQATRNNARMLFLKSALHTACSASDSPSRLNVLILEAISSTAIENTREMYFAVYHVQIDELIWFSDRGPLAKLVRATVATCLDRQDTDLAATYVKSASAFAVKTGSAYPRHELEWLATTCWNQGVRAREEQSAAREFWCEKAIDFASRVSGFADMHSAMERYYRQMRQTLLS